METPRRCRKTSRRFRYEGLVKCTFLHHDSARRKDTKIAWCAFAARHAVPAGLRRTPWSTVASIDILAADLPMHSREWKKEGNRCLLLQVMNHTSGYLKRSPSYHEIKSSSNSETICQSRDSQSRKNRLCRPVHFTLTYCRCIKCRSTVVML